MRFSWQVWPSTRLEAQRIVVPLGCLYTPLKRIENLPVFGYDPLRCNGCSAVLNPYASVDFSTKLWTCPFCTARNHFPPAYAESIGPNNLPPELVQQYTTIEFEINSVAPSGPPTFLFLVDICIDEEQQLAELRDSLQQTLNLLPEDSLVGLITFGALVHVHEIGFTDCNKSYVFKGDKDYLPQKVQDMLGIAPVRGGVQQSAAQMNGRSSAIGRFLMPVSECTFALEQILEDLQKVFHSLLLTHSLLLLSGVNRIHGQVITMNVYNVALVLH